MTDAFSEAITSVLDEEVAKKERATVTLSEAQKYIDYGNKVFLLTPSVASQPMVVGRIVMPSDWADIRSLVQHVGHPEGPNEPIPSDAELEAKHADGYRLGLFFGEDYSMGYAAIYHISRMYPLTESEYEGIREANCDPSEAAKLPFFKQLEDNIISALEAQPNSPYRKRCEKCGSGRVMLAEYYEARNLSPIALRMNVVGQSLDILTAHAVDQKLIKAGRRCFHCQECKWESEPLSMEEYPEVHACSHEKSPLEALFDVERFVI